jgi:hypothetical protein
VFGERGEKDGRTLEMNRLENVMAERTNLLFSSNDTTDKPVERSAAVNASAPVVPKNS